MFRGHIRVSPAFPAEEQHDALVAAGVPKRAIYTDDIASAMRSLRKGNQLVVVGFRALGDSREEIEKVLGDAHAFTCAVKDAATGRLSMNKKDAAMLIAEALKDLANERRGPRKAPRGRMPWDQIEEKWFRKLPRKNNDEIMEEINRGRRGRAKISYATVYRKLGKRDVLTGRPSKR